MRQCRAIVLAIVVSAMIGCLSGTEVTYDELKIVGSDTMLELDRRLAEAFMRAHPGVRVEVSGGGSGVGIASMIEGDASMAAASRPLTAAEVALLHERHQTLGVRTLVAQDALSVFLNAANPVRDLSLEQLGGIFEGTITDWGEVGGNPGPVRVVVRPPSSGTHRFFRDHVLAGRSYVSGAVSVPTTSAVLAEVAADPLAVGYGGVAYRLEGVASVMVEGVEPTPEDVGRGRYPLTRYLVFYTVEPATGLTRRFIDWCLGPDGQRVVADIGYVPLWVSPP